jgi:hypothetical protein
MMWAHLLQKRMKLQHHQHQVVVLDPLNPLHHIGHILLFFVDHQDLREKIKFQYVH